jgi:DNA-binding response OmpR family regulator
LSSFSAAAVSAEIYEDSHLLVNFQTGTMLLDGRFIRMPRKEFELLAFLVQHARELVTRDSLLTMIWGYGQGVRTRTLDVHIRRLRQNLGPYGKLYIETVFSIGYRFQPCPGERAEPVALPAGPPELVSGSGAWRWNYTAQ